MNVKPIRNEVILEILDLDNVTASGIILADDTTKKGLTGLVVDVAKVQDVEIGNKVMIGKHIGKEVKQGGKTFVIIDEKHILAIIED